MYWREVFANKKTATRSEFYTAKQAGDKIALVLEVRGADYQEETLVEYEGRLYEVVRAYTESGETYELNCKEAQEPPAYSARRGGRLRGQESGLHHVQLPHNPDQLRGRRAGTGAGLRPGPSIRPSRL